MSGAGSIVGGSEGPLTHGGQLYAEHSADQAAPVSNPMGLDDSIVTGGGTSHHSVKVDQSGYNHKDIRRRADGTPFISPDNKDSASIANRSYFEIETPHIDEAIHSIAANLIESSTAAIHSLNSGHASDAAKFGHDLEKSIKLIIQYNKNELSTQDLNMLKAKQQELHILRKFLKSERPDDFVLHGTALDYLKRGLCAGKDVSKNARQLQTFLSRLHGEAVAGDTEGTIQMSKEHFGTQLNTLGANRLETLPAIKRENAFQAQVLAQRQKSSEQNALAKKLGEIQKQQASDEGSTTPTPSYKT